MNCNWVTPKVEPRPSGDKGWGVFAIEPIARGETVVGFGGWVITLDEVVALGPERQKRTLQVDDHLYMASGPERETADMVNHSCEPNCGLAGSQILIAMRDIEVGEELSFDYATCDGSDYDEFPCFCESADCRGSVTGSDWRRPEIQARYLGWFSPYLAARIASGV